MKNALNGKTVHSIMALLLTLGCQAATGAEENGADGKSTEELKTIADIRENSEHHDGLFELYTDREDGTLYMVIEPDQLDREYIYFAHTTDGPVEGGHFRGAYIGNSVFSLQRHYKRIEFVEENTAFYIDPASPLTRSAKANISHAVLAVQDIVAEDQRSGAVAIKLGDVLLKEQLQQIKPTPDPDAKPKDGFALGTLSEKRNKIVAVRNYPENTAVTAEYVYENPAPVVAGGDDITNSRAVSIRVQHTLIEMPDNSYQPRRDDYRIGYFMSRVTDLTTHSAAPYRDLIARWDLQKKNPDAAISDPVEPITWWIENTTPHEYRDLIRDAALAWNPAFEQAGFSNAIEVKVQPDDADWDAGDIRYNVLRWTASPNPPFGGYGPSFINPRSGQILGADVMLEYSFFTNRLRTQSVLQEIAGQQPAANTAAAKYCSLGHGMQLSNLFGQQALQAAGATTKLQEQLIRDSMYYLILHEIGHTLGLNHNMKATQLVANPFDAKEVDERGLAGSIMDYPAVNVAPPGVRQTLFYADAPGPYDAWAIEYGYSPALDDIEAEQKRLTSILSRSSEPELAFGNDADDMRSPGKAIDPRVNIYDLSSDAIGYATGRMSQADKMLDTMLERFTERGSTWQSLHDGYLALMSEYARSAAVVSRYIGGVYIDRSPAGTANGTNPFTPVSLADQQRALNVLERHVFAPGSVPASDKLVSHLQQQRRSFDFYETTEDPKLHEWALNLHRGVLDHLLHPVTMKRITDSRRYGNEYDLAMFMGDLSDAIFAADLRGEVDTQRQNLQLEYVNRLAAMVKGDSKAEYDYPSQSIALLHLNQLGNQLRSKRQGSVETRAHTRHLLYVIDTALNTT
ncbi:MAG: zinc-dependent metalloprotease [Gammaproteobacteria bacterium]|nr:zinc-dependent metalloprotease [Gammaproteobacteria bacterium]